MEWQDLPTVPGRYWAMDGTDPTRVYLVVVYESMLKPGTCGWVRLENGGQYRVEHFAGFMGPIETPAPRVRPLLRLVQP